MKKSTKSEREMIEFNKRYDSFKKNNLPTPFLDHERETLEYVLFSNSIWCENKLIATPNLYNAFEEIIWDNFYYPFNARHYEGHYDKNNKWVTEEVIGHMHEHDFDYVIRWVYNSPETFSINKEDEHYYSDQELRFIKHLQGYLNLIGLKDCGAGKPQVNRYRNKMRKKYEKAYVRKASDEIIKAILAGELNYEIYQYKVGDKLKNYKKGERRALIMNQDDKFVMSLEFGKSELREYKEVKKYYKMDLKDTDKVIVNYFKLLEKF